MNSGRFASTSRPITCSTRPILKTASARPELPSRAERNSSFDMNRGLLLGLCFALSAAGADMPRRIVSLSPNLTEILYGMGAFDQIAGVSDYCTYPPEVTKLPSVGGWHN